MRLRWEKGNEKRAVYGTALQMPGRNEKGARWSALPFVQRRVLVFFEVSRYEPETSER
jgi:hypothetical protein